MEANLLYFSHRLDEIDQRLNALDKEWGIERTLETNAGIIALVGLGLSMFWPKAKLLPAIVAGFLVQHAVQGWCPPVPLMRRLGVRTTKEINEERVALRAMRGDFQSVASGNGDSPLHRSKQAVRVASNRQR